MGARDLARKRVGRGSLDDPGGIVARMRKGWRKVVLGLIAFFVLGDRDQSIAQAREGGGPVRLTIEIGWTVPNGRVPAEREAWDLAGSSVDLEVAGGRIVDLAAWPSSPGTSSAPSRRADGICELGRGRSG